MNDDGIGPPIDTINYEYDTNSNIYYNKINYNGNKDIIGNLILSDGQPCYKINETLWRKFYKNEANDTCLKCKTTIFGKRQDDRYEIMGDIAYKQFYEDNLASEYKDKIIKEIKTETVSLYKRIFLGIDKECEEKSNLSKNKADIVSKSLKNEKDFLLVGAIAFFIFILSVLAVDVVNYCNGKFDDDDNIVISIFIILIIILVYTIVNIICQGIFIKKIIDNELSFDCSDSITNELLNKEMEKIKNSKTYTAVNLGADVACFLLCSCLMLSYFFCKYCKSKLDKRKNNNDTESKYLSMKETDNSS